MNGTISDLAVSGARPLALSASLILEEGLAADVLRGEVEAIVGAAARTSVPVVRGDTKVVERGKCDGIYVVTTGVGVAPAGPTCDPSLPHAGQSGRGVGGRQRR